MDNRNLHIKPIKECYGLDGELVCDGCCCRFSCANSIINRKKEDRE